MARESVGKGKRFTAPTGCTTGVDDLFEFAQLVSVGVNHEWSKGSMPTESGLMVNQVS